MLGWTQMTVFVVLSFMGALRMVGTEAPPAPTPVCFWCHEDAPPDEATSTSLSATRFAQRADTAQFTHDLHLPVSCENCHVGIRRPNPRDYGWCDSCHHRPQSTDACVRCHETGPDPEQRFDSCSEMVERSASYSSPGDGLESPNLLLREKCRQG